MHIDKSSTIVRSTKPAETTVGTEVVLMLLESGECIGLGETGSEVWRLLKEPTRFDQVVEILCQSYDAPHGVIEQHVLELLQQMLDRNLVEVSIHPALGTAINR